MRIYDDLQLDYCDVLLRPKRSALTSRSEVNIIREYTFKWCPKTINATGIVAANMATTGTFEIAKVMQANNLFTALHKHYTTEELIKFLEQNQKEHGNNDLVFVSTGVNEKDFEKLQAIMEKELVNNICIDVANGYSPYLLSYVKRVRSAYPDSLIMAGNVVTGDMCEDLIINGADIVKVGIGPGSVCTTRKLTGVGRPQFSTVVDCADAAHGVGGMVCADGGCTVAGDLCKSFCAGADFIMLGGMLAGHDESGGVVCTKTFQTNELEPVGETGRQSVVQAEQPFHRFRIATQHDGDVSHILIRQDRHHQLEDMLAGVVGMWWVQQICLVNHQHPSLGGLQHSPHSLLLITEVRAQKRAP